MYVLKCKMCGGDLQILPNQTSGKCEYCSSVMALPKVDEERTALLFNRANHLRAQKEFDKAQMAYAGITAEKPDCAEAYWGEVLCRFGIEYVPDPATGERKPTMHRMQFDSVLNDENYKSALSCADPVAKALYAREAELIDRIQKRYLAISSREEPFDVFICYKETGERGRTPDSVYAQEIYQELTRSGLRVFFSRITLEDKLGEAYEPYIFSALNSAKVMLVVGASAENLRGAWVKNEWQRYLYLMRANPDKHLIPVYRDMDFYDMPEEFLPLQGQDYAKLGALQDLTRGVMKLAGKNQPAPLARPARPEESALLTRAYISIEDGEFEEAEALLENDLNQNPTSARAYLGKLLCALRLTGEEALSTCAKDYENDINYKRAVRYADAPLREALEGCAAKARACAKYARAVEAYMAARVPGDLVFAAKLALEAAPLEPRALETARDCALLCLLRAAREQARKLKSAEELYERACAAQEHPNGAVEYEAALRMFEKIPGVKDADARAQTIRNNLASNAANNLYFNAQTRQELLAAALALEKLPNAQNEETRNHARDARCKIALLQTAEALERPLGAEELHAIARELDAFGENEFALNAAHACRSRAEKAQLLALHAVGPEMIQALSKLCASRGIVRDFEKMIYAEGRAKELSLYWKAMREYALCGRMDASEVATAFVRTDGTVGVTGICNYGQANTASWRNVAAVACGAYHTAGLMADGRVCAAGKKTDGQLATESWQNAVCVCAGFSHTAALFANGTVRAAGANEHGQLNVQNWTDIVSIAAGDFFTAGLRGDGTIMCTNDNIWFKCNNLGWADVAAISAKGSMLMGLRANGTALQNPPPVASALPETGDITSVFAGHDFAAALNAEGRLLLEGVHKNDALKAAEAWTGVAAAALGAKHIAALRFTGEVLSAGESKFSQNIPNLLSAPTLSPAQPLAPKPMPAAPRPVPAPRPAPEPEPESEPKGLFGRLFGRKKR